MRGVTRATVPVTRVTGFQLTRLMRGVTKNVSTVLLSNLFQLTRLMRGVTLTFASLPILQVFQLTRLMRGVTHHFCSRNPLFIISTHTPHARRDLTRRSESAEQSKFQLTRLMRGVTGKRDLDCHISVDFNSHASCEA